MTDSKTQFVHTTESPEETRALGARIGKRLRAGDVLALSGELGAGKTCLVQGLAIGLGVDPNRRVGSPTFTLVNEHEGRVPLYHIDLYRLEKEDELEHMGLADYLNAEAVIAVEWFERFPSYRPREHLAVTLEIDSAGHRMIRVTPEGADLAARFTDFDAYGAP